MPQKTAPKTKQQTPLHVAIIPDGNRRWAKGRGLVATAGHAKSTEKERVIALLKEANRLGIRQLTIWGFSTENWKRSKEEQATIFLLVQHIVNDLVKDAKRHNIKFRCFGRRDRLPKGLITDIINAEQATAANDALTFSICLDYGGRDEIVRAVNAILTTRTSTVDEEELASFLDTKGLPDPDLIIRTGGEQRLSGFLPWQSIYAELYFTKTFFPDFGPNELRKAVTAFRKRNRRFGGDDAVKT